MKTKKALKLIKEILVLANELQQKQNVMKAVSAPIPEYKKGGLAFVQNNGKETIVTPDGKNIAIVNLADVKGKTFQEVWDEIKPKDIIEAMENYTKSFIESDVLNNIEKPETPFDDIYNKSKEEELVFEIESVSFSVENNHGFLKLKLPFRYSEISHLRKGMKVTVKPNYNKPERTNLDIRNENTVYGSGTLKWDNQKPTSFSEAFEKAKTEDSVLKEAYDFIEKTVSPKVSKFQQKLNEAMLQAKKAKEQ